MAYMTIEMRGSILGVIPVGRFKELPIGRELPVNDGNCVRTVCAESPNLLYVTGRMRGNGFFRNTPYRDEINSLTLGTMIPGVKKQFRWKPSI